MSAPRTSRTWRAPPSRRRLYCCSENRTEPNQNRTRQRKEKKRRRRLQTPRKGVPNLNLAKGDNAVKFVVTPGASGQKRPEQHTNFATSRACLQSRVLTCAIGAECTMVRCGAWDVAGGKKDRAFCAVFGKAGLPAKGALKKIF